MIRVKLYRYNEFTEMFYCMIIHLISNDREIEIIRNGNRISVDELKALCFTSMRIEVDNER